MALPELPERVAAIQTLLRLAAHVPVSQPATPAASATASVSVVRGIRAAAAGVARGLKGKRARPAELEPCGEEGHGHAREPAPQLSGRAAVLEPPRKPGSWSGLRLLEDETLVSEAARFKDWLVEELAADPPYELSWIGGCSEEGKVSGGQCGD